MEKSMISPTARFSGERPPRLRSVLLPANHNVDILAFVAGGAPVNKYCELGSLSSTETNYCRLSLLASADALLSFPSERTLTLLPEANPFEARVCPCRIVAPARRAPRGVGMSLDADLPQADVRQSEFLVPVHCPLQTNGRSGHIIELHRSSRGNR